MEAVFDGRSEVLLLVSPSEAREIKIMIDQEIISELEHHYYLPKAVSILKPKSGYSSETWIIKVAGGKRFVFQKHPQGFKKERVQFIHAVLGYLAAHDFPVPQIVPTKSNHSFVERDGDYYCIFEFCEGKTFDSSLVRWNQTKTLTEAGRTLARLHRMMEEFYPEGVENYGRHPYPWCIEKLHRHFKLAQSTKPEPAFEAYFIRHAGLIEGWLTSLGSWLEVRQAELSRSVIHGDFSPANLLFRKNEVVAVLDFNSVRWDTRTADLAHMLVAFSKGRLQSNLNFSTMDELLRSYLEVVPLPENEVGLLPVLLIYDRVENLLWLLTQYQKHGLKKAASWFKENVELVIWMQKERPRIEDLCRDAVKVISKS